MITTIMTEESHELVNRIRLYVMLKNGIVVFFYVNNIVFCYKKTDEKKA